MMKTIWKFEINARTKIQMPDGAEILSVQMQQKNPVIWVLVNPNNDCKERVFEVYGTGHEIHYESSDERVFIGTFQMPEQNLVFHLFELKNNI